MTYKYILFGTIKQLVIYVFNSIKLEHQKNINKLLTLYLFM